ncbi:hypothetical protein LYSHEL_31320 [Lysobacter helvus]|uniref:Alpha/beta hydrolase n=2 Tax=Lysobacteraceae TaxID=32033 RepID=A0ABN6FXP1_9GAMM|nr:MULTISPECIES: hypothetical protein [Lysobacter]BCT94105.1 hypothetical protein LYSCAS_31290 [Lysobacter caseinilyticus]BCT97261.1 hypothetical protein LYSHEL_31320 [Lysobacter helvus]
MWNRPALAFFSLAFALTAHAAGPERVEARIATAADPAQQYALFVPKDAGANAPLLIVLDPRGRAVATRDFVIEAARARGWIVMSSWQSRSDTDEAVTLRALDALWKESARYPHDARRVYLAGMSGTAKTLWVVAPKLHVAGLLGSAGGRPPELPPLTRNAPAFQGFTGMSDFNHREMFALDAALAGVGTPHRLDVSPGGHGWPPVEAFADALAWFDLQAMRSGRMPRDAAFIEQRFSACTTAADAGFDALERWRLQAQCVRDFEGLRDVAALRTNVDALEKSSDVARLRSQDDKLAADERRYARRFDAWRERFGRRFVEGLEQPPLPLNESLRQLQIATLRKRAADADPRVAASAQRLLAWVHAAAAFYLPAQFDAKGDHNRAVALGDLAEATAPVDDAE